MFNNYYYPFYRSFGYSPYPNPWANPWAGQYGPNFGTYHNSNVIGSTVANQSMTTIGAGAVGGTQNAVQTLM